MMRCDMCNIKESASTDLIQVDFYGCDKCSGVVCHNCVYTSMQGKDFCATCKQELQKEGKL
mgnify:CR=1 FL=1